MLSVVSLRDPKVHRKRLAGPMNELVVYFLSLSLRYHVSFRFIDESLYFKLEKKVVTVGNFFC